MKNPERAEQVFAVASVCGVASFLAAAAMQGISAVDAHSEGVKAEAVAIVLEAQGNPEASEWQDYADRAMKERQRRINGVGLCLIGALTVNIANSSLQPRNRRG